MIITRINIVPQNEIDRKEQMISEICACPICGSKMEFAFEAFQIEQEGFVKETRECKSCELKIGEEEFRQH